MQDDLQTIYQGGTIEQAHLLRNLLEEQGITAWVQNEVLGAAVGGLPPGMTTLPRVDVANHDAARARQLVDAFDRQLRVGPPPEDDAFSDTRTASDVTPAPDWTGWPCCPDCGQRRNTHCPICHDAGNEFPLAEYNVAAPTAVPAEQGENRVASLQLLVCSVCDEAFHPRFYRRCAWCGHDFEDGVETENLPRERIGERAVLVMVALGALAMLMFGYLWFLFR